MAKNTERGHRLKLDIPWEEAATRLLKVPPSPRATKKAAVKKKTVKRKKA